MTDWDKIYKDYQRGGEFWATLSEDIHPLFKQLLGQSNFKLKHAFDIGCGTGKYLKFLQSFGFKTDGIDSSETAVQMTKELFNDESVIEYGDMFNYDIPENKYDLIISVATIHHGTKENVQNLIDKIHSILVDGGKIFITVPDYESVGKWDTFKNHEELSPGTFAPLDGPEKGLPHSFYTKEDAQKLFSKFNDLKLELDERGRWVAQAQK